MIVIDKYSYPYRLDLLLTKRDFKAVQDKFKKCLEESDTLKEAINKFHEGNILPISLAHNAGIENPKKIEDFTFFLLVDRYTPYGAFFNEKDDIF